MWSELDHPIIRPQIPLTPLYEWGPTWSPHCGEFTVPGDTLTSIWDNLTSSCSTLERMCFWQSNIWDLPFRSCFGLHICIYTVYVYIYICNLFIYIYIKNKYTQDIRTYLGDGFHCHFTSGGWGSSPPCGSTRVDDTWRPQGTNTPVTSSGDFGGVPYLSYRDNIHIIIQWDITIKK